MHTIFCSVVFLPSQYMDVRWWVCYWKPPPLLLSENIWSENIIWCFLFISWFSEKFLGFKTSKVKPYHFVFIKFCYIMYFLYGDNAQATVIWKWFKSIFYFISLQPCWHNWVTRMSPPFFKRKTLTTEKYKCSFPNSQRKGTSRAEIVCIFKSYILTCSKPCLFERNFPIFSSFIRRLDGAVLCSKSLK